MSRGGGGGTPYFGMIGIEWPSYFLGVVINDLVFLGVVQAKSILKNITGSF